MVAADRHGVRIVLGVYGRADDAPSTPEEREDYCRYVRNILLRYSEIRDVVIWNEANSDAFWRPHGRAPAAAYAALLSRCWDLLHSTVPGVNVVTTTAASHDPVGFLGAVAEAYRASGRSRPLFDTVGHNPYPLYPDEVPDALHHVYVGQGDHARLVSMLDQSFAGTAQPQTSIWYLENGFQTSVASVASLAVRRSRERRRRGLRRTPGRAARSGAAPRLLPAARHRVLQLPARRRAVARPLAVGSPLGRLEAEAVVRRVPGGDRGRARRCRDVCRRRRGRAPGDARGAVYGRRPPGCRTPLTRRTYGT